MGNLMNCMGYYGWKIRRGIRTLLSDERGDVNVVAIVVLIAVAVVLALLLKDQLGQLIKTMINNITNKANTALDDI